MKKINIKGVSVQTWARTVILLLALAGQLCVILGKRNGLLGSDQWQEYAIYALTVISSVWSWWKNNSFTSAAQKADNANPAHVPTLNLSSGESILFQK